MIETHFGEQPLKAQPTFRRAAALPLIFVDDDHLLTRPTQLHRTIRQAILQEVVPVVVEK